MPSNSSARVANVLFQYRLWREGKLEEYWNRRAECKAKGATFGTEATTTASKKAMAVRKNFGWLGPRNEFEREKEHQFRPLINKRKEMMAEYARNKGRSAVDKALANLPPVASVEQEMAWVRSHPKMTRALTSKLVDEEYKPPKPNVGDITGVTPPCPSRGAWNTLLSALGDPKKFNDVLLTRQKDGAVKAADGANESEGAVMDDLAEVERMLRAASERKLD